MTRLDRNPSGLRSFFTDLFHIQQLYHSAPRQKKGKPRKGSGRPFPEHARFYFATRTNSGGSS
ncbi:hypothetical protein CXU14_12160 [Akkermansia muciniphila]|nr:hypothetical protein CXU16_10050 [Akkermansia muciniphila]PNC42357.1 hypothetical protein CXU14_12160 [Akkermansia muciniphila]